MTSRPDPVRPRLAASVAVVRDGRVLVAQRARGPLADLFSLPGGVVEAGETLAEAALRELREEVDVEAEILGLVAPVEWIDRRPTDTGDDVVLAHVVIMAHAARWLAGEGTTGPEAKAVLWVDADELARLPTTPGLGPVVAAALAMASMDARSA